MREFMRKTYVGYFGLRRLEVEVTNAISIGLQVKLHWGKRRGNSYWQGKLAQTKSTIFIIGLVFWTVQINFGKWVNRPMLEPRVAKTLGITDYDPL